jgi:hypothetical protein
MKKEKAFENAGLCMNNLITVSLSIQA